MSWIDIIGFIVAGILSISAVAIFVWFKAFYEPRERTRDFEMFCKYCDPSEEEKREYARSIFK